MNISAEMECITLEKWWQISLPFQLLWLFISCTFFFLKPIRSEGGSHASWITETPKLDVANQSGTVGYPLFHSSVMNVPSHPAKCCFLWKTKHWKIFSFSEFSVIRRIAFSLQGVGGGRNIKEKYHPIILTGSFQEVFFKSLSSLVESRIQFLWPNGGAFQDAS